MFDGICEVVIEINPKWTDKDDVGPHGSTTGVWKTMPVEEYHLSDIEIFGVVESVAIEAFD